MAKSTAMERITTALTIKSYEDREVLLKEAKQEAFNSRIGLFQALGLAAMWYRESIRDRAYMLSKFEAAGINIPNPATNDLTVPTVKLIFDLNEPRYYSRASEYALCIQYINAKMGADEFKDNEDNPAVIKAIFEDAGGIRKMVTAQRNALNAVEKGHTASEEDEFLQSECSELYKTKKAAGSLKVALPADNKDFVMMVGRPGKGSIEVVDVIGMDLNQVYSLTKDRIFSDTSNLPDTLNLLGDALGFYHVFDKKTGPVVTVEKGGHHLLLSLGSEYDASVVVTVEPKQKTILKGFKNRAHMSVKDLEWFVSNAQSRIKRRMYDLVMARGVKSAEVAYKLNSKIKDDMVKVLHFNKITPATERQVVRQAMASGDWCASAELGRVELLRLASWCEGWSKVKRKKAEEKIIPILFRPDEIVFEGLGGSKNLAFAAETGLVDVAERKYALLGRELAAVIFQLQLNADVPKVQFRVPRTGMVEISSEDRLARYSVDVPTVQKDCVNHQGKHFTHTA